MRRKPHSFTALLERWPNLMVVATDLNLSQFTVRAWHRRNSVPARYWDALEASARRHGLTGVSYDRFREIESRRWHSLAHNDEPARPSIPGRARSVNQNAPLVQDAQTKPAA